MSSRLDDFDEEPDLDSLYVEDEEDFDEDEFDEDEEEDDDWDDDDEDFD